MKFNKIFVFLLVFCGLLISCDAFDEDDENSVGGGEATSYDMQIFNLVNAHRKQKGLAALKFDDAFSISAAFIQKTCQLAKLHLGIMALMIG